MQDNCTRRFVTSFYRGHQWVVSLNAGVNIKFVSKFCLNCNAAKIRKKIILIWINFRDLPTPKNHTAVEVGEQM